MKTAIKQLILFNGGAVDSPLLTDLVDNWPLDESSGNRTGAHAGIVLTDTNTVTSGTGKISNAASFARANSERLIASDTATLSTGNIDFTIACWVNFTTLTSGSFTLASKFASGESEWVLDYEKASDNFRFYVSNDGSSLTIQSASTFGTASTGTWYWVCAWHDSVNDTLNIQINNGDVDSQAYSSGVNDGTSEFQLGARGGANHLNGLLDEFNFWKRVLTADEKTELYNSGSGLAYPF